MNSFHASKLNIKYKLPVRNFECSIIRVGVILCCFPNISSSLSSRHRAERSFLALKWLNEIT